MALNLDIAPTILELAALQIPAQIQGHSLVPLMKGIHLSDWRKDWLYEYYDDRWAPRNRGIRTERYKLIQYWEKNPEELELYDLETDPGELNNLYGDQRYIDLVAQLKNRIRELRTESGDPFV
jgi:arylsulfatase A-like enzyme